MRKSIVKQKWTRNEPVLITCLHLTDPSLHELVSLMGFDGIWLDLEHHGYSVEKAGELIRAARVGATDVMCRPGKGEFMRLGRLLEAGAKGVLYPRCSDAIEAAEVVKWSKFAPLGERGFDGANGDMPYCTMDMAEYVRVANEETWITVQIEDPVALARAEEIACVPGVDCIMLGPGDFSVLSGFPGDFNHPRLQAAVQSISVAAKNSGKQWGMPVAHAARAKEIMGLGARLLCCGADIIHVLNALRELQRSFGEIGFTFNNQLDKAHGYQSRT